MTYQALTQQISEQNSFYSQMTYILVQQTIKNV